MSESGEKRESVVFLGVPRTYLPKENLSVTYRCDPGLQPTSRDWVGLFRVGWTTSRDYYTFEWAPAPSDDKREGSVTFAGRRLPPEDGHFYQVCYVSRDGTVRGASAPFQFTPPSTSLGSLDDLELVEVSEEGLSSMMVLQPRSRGEVERLRGQCEEARAELSSVQMSFTVLQSEKATLAEQLEVVENEKGALEGTVKERDVRVGELERQLQTMRESEQKLMEKLEKERAQNRELLVAKTSEESQLEVLRKQALEQRSEVAALGGENADLKKQLRIKESQVEDLQQLASARNEEIERLGVQMEELMHIHEEDKTVVQEMQTAMESKQQQVERLQQDLSVAHENIAELMGARDMLHEQLQQSEQPSGPANTVDRSAYEALQVAYENMENYYRKAEQEKENVCIQLQQSQEVVQTLEDKCDELMARIERARKEFESKAVECVELRRQLKGVGGGEGEGNVQLRERVRELEERQDQMADNCEAAVRELSARGEECKALEAQLAQVQHEFDALQQKHDEKLHVKNEALERQQAVLDAKLAELSVTQERGAELERELERAARDKAKAEEKVRELRGQIEKLKGSAKDGTRACPVCDTKFPTRMVQSEFERHVQAHFQD